MYELCCVVFVFLQHRCQYVRVRVRVRVHVCVYLLWLYGKAIGKVVVNHILTLSSLTFNI
ncbi:Golgi to ER traffic protein 4-like protein [Iris pallida]|uniref:Golgi to ER traffic protein 4-like protein n=1 Tax=Iris pallida TaxID=29817 RepID=A0AAX6F8P1_IRIPA|nr:Golgi to ER traffic protein 4-like protein [Iris pallida]